MRQRAGMVLCLSLRQASLAQAGALSVSRLISLGVPPAQGGAAVPPLADVDTLCVELEDAEEADLLSRLPSCLAFARQAAADGAVLLVACHAGAW